MTGYLSPQAKARRDELALAIRTAVLKPDAIFDRDGKQVWPVRAEKKQRTVYFDVSVDAPINPFSGTKETYLGPDPSSPAGSNWGWYRDEDGGTSFRVRSKR
jgi:hypothetical protein